MRTQRYARDGDAIGSKSELSERRYDDLGSGRVKLVPGDEVFARLRAKSAARRAERR